MIRHYDHEPVPRETLERIVATVRRAPSGGFSQGQRLLVVDDPALLAQMAAMNDDAPTGTAPWFGSSARADPGDDARSGLPRALSEGRQAPVAGVTLVRPLPDPEWS